MSRNRLSDVVILLCVLLAQSAWRGTAVGAASSRVVDYGMHDAMVCTL
jgi:hypothetical protein